MKMIKEILTGLLLIVMGVSFVLVSLLIGLAVPFAALKYLFGG